MQGFTTSSYGSGLSTRSRLGTSHRGETALSFELLASKHLLDPDAIGRPASRFPPKLQILLAQKSTNKRKHTHTIGTMMPDMYALLRTSSRLPSAGMLKLGGEGTESNIQHTSMKVVNDEARGSSNGGAGLETGVVGVALLPFNAYQRSWLIKRTSPYVAVVCRSRLQRQTRRNFHYSKSTWRPPYCFV